MSNRPAVPHRPSAPVSAPGLIVLVAALLLLAGCGEAPPPWYARIHDLTGVPLSDELRPAVDDAVARLGTPVPDTRAARDFRTYVDLDLRLARNADLEQAADELLALWERDPDSILWPRLVYDHRQRIGRRDEVLRLAAREAVSDTTTAIGCAVRAYVYGVHSGGRNWITASYELRDQFVPFPRAMITWARWGGTFPPNRLRAQIPALVSVLADARASAGPLMESQVWSDIADALITHDRLDDGLWAATLACATAIESGYPNEELAARNRIADALAARGETELAISALDRQAARADSVGDYELAITTLQRAGALASQAGQYERAMGFDRRSVRFARLVYDGFYTPQTLANIADNHRLLGNLDSTGYYLDLAAEEVRNSRWRSNDAQMAELLAEFACQVGRYAEAESLLIAAGAGARTSGSTLNRATLMLRMVPMALETGRPDLAYKWLAEVEHAEWFLPTRSNDMNRQAELYTLKSQLLMQQGETRLAAEALAKARAAIDHVDDPAGRWQLEAHAGRLAQRRGDPEGAERHYLVCLDMALKDSEPRNLARARFQLGELYLDQGRFADARAMFTLLATENTFGHAYRTGMTSLLMLGLTCEREGDLAGAEAHLNEALARLRPDSPVDLALRVKLAHARVRSRLGHTREAGEALLALRDTRDTELQHFADLEIFREGVERDLQSALVANCVRAEGLEGRKTGPTTLALAFPDLARRLSAGSLPGPALVFLVDREASWAWTVAGADVRLRRLPGSGELEKRLVPVLTDLSEPDRPVDVAILADLSSLLLGDLAATWTAATTLHLVPDGLLRLVPWAALPLPGGDDVLLDRGPLVEWPVTGPVPGEGRPRHPRDLDLLAAGCDDPASGDAVLRQAEREAIELAATWPGPAAVELVGPTANWAAVLEAGATTAGVIHIASHAEIHQGTRHRSTLRLATAGEGAPVTMDEVTRLRFAAELVYLSSCRSGQSLAAPVAGPDDFTEAFLGAGARTVIASTSWIDDAVARHLATSFYGHWNAGLSRAAAFRAARLDIRREHPDPAYWAFVRLVGAGD